MEEEKKFSKQEEGIMQSSNWRNIDRREAFSFLFSFILKSLSFFLSAISRWRTREKDSRRALLYKTLLASLES